MANEIIQLETTQTISEVSKSQFVRVADVVAIGPAMLYAGYVLSTYKLARSNRALGFALIAIGAGTIFYNGRNYLINQKRLKAA